MNNEQTTKGQGRAGQGNNKQQTMNNEQTTKGQGRAGQGRETTNKQQTMNNEQTTNNKRAGQGRAGVPRVPRKWMRNRDRIMDEDT